MKNYFLFILAVFCFTVNQAAAQTIKFKYDLAYVDGKQFVRLEDKSPVQFTIISFESDSELVFVRQFDPTPNDGLNGFDDRFFVLSFADYDGEIEFKDSRKSELIKFLYIRKIIHNGRISKTSFDSFFASHGRKE